ARPGAPRGDLHTNYFGRINAVGWIRTRPSLEPQYDVQSADCEDAWSGEGSLSEARSRGRTCRDATGVAPSKQITIEPQDLPDRVPPRPCGAWEMERLPGFPGWKLAGSDRGPRTARPSGRESTAVQRELGPPDHRDGG